MTYRQFNKAKRKFGPTNLPQYINVYQKWFDDNVDRRASDKVNNHMYCLSSIYNIKFSNDCILVWFADVHPKVQFSANIRGEKIPRDAISYME